MDFLNQYIVLVVLGICLCVGFILKKLVPSEKVDNFIPLILGLLGVFLNIWVSGWQISPVILLGGLASGLASTGSYEAVTQLIDFFRKKKNE